MLRNMTNSLFTHEAIKTTLPKAKELRRVAEPLITLGKSPTLSNRRLAFDRLRDTEVVYKLFNELGPRYAKRPGGYLRILKFSRRPRKSAGRKPGRPRQPSGRERAKSRAHQRPVFLSWIVASERESGSIPPALAGRMGHGAHST